MRDLAKASPLIPKGSDIEVVQGDLVANYGIAEALRGIHTAYYLVHSMGGKTLFKNEEYAEKDRDRAEELHGRSRVSRAQTGHLPGRARRNERQPVGASPEPRRDRADHFIGKAEGNGPARRDHHRRGRRVLRDAALPRGAPAGHDHAQVGRDAHPAHRHQGRPRIPRRLPAERGDRGPGVRHRRAPRSSPTWK